MTESLAWECPRCQAWCWNHHLHCSACGTEKPTETEGKPDGQKAQAEATPAPEALLK